MLSKTKVKTHILFCSLFFFPVIFYNYLETQATVYHDSVECELVSIYDGDTFKVNIKGWPDIIGKNIGVRVLGIDTPEIHDKNLEVKTKALRAKEFAHNILTTTNIIRLRNLQRDKYFRILAEVDCDGINFSKKMLDSGLAKEYNGGTKDEWKSD